MLNHCSRPAKLGRVEPGRFTRKTRILDTPCCHIRNRYSVLVLIVGNLRLIGFAINSPAQCYISCYWQHCTDAQFSIQDNCRQWHVQVTSSLHDASLHDAEQIVTNLHDAYLPSRRSWQRYPIFFLFPSYFFPILSLFFSDLFHDLFRFKYSVFCTSVRGRGTRSQTGSRTGRRRRPTSTRRSSTTSWERANRRTSCAPSGRITPSGSRAY